MMRLALCQMACGSPVVATNIAAAQATVGRAAAAGANFVVLPECWNSPYQASEFPRFAEPVPEVGAAGAEDPEASPSVAAMCDLAREHSVWLVGGSIPERGADGRVFNTSLALSPEGVIVARHRKMHLFDIDVPGRITFKESDTLSAGDDVTTFETPFGVVGLAICYDVRFPLLAALMRRRGCSMLVYPGAFNMTTGPAHWELLLRARANDNQVFVAGVAPARDPAASYQAWGHTTLVGPWGDVLATTEEGEAMLVQDVDLGAVEEIRSSIPISGQERPEVYALADVSCPSRA